MSVTDRITVTVDILLKDGSSLSTKYMADTSVEPFKIEGLVFCLERSSTAAPVPE